MYLTRINDIIRGVIHDKHGRYFPHCATGASKFVTMARKKGYPKRIKHVSGFCNGSPHHWCVDDVTGWIYDPTQLQFFREFKSVVRKCDQRYSSYEEVDEPGEWWHYGPQSDAYSSWRKLMSWEDLTGQRDTLTVGKDISELRTSVKGDPYVYVQNEVYFSHHMFTNMAHTVTHENIRCATIFKSNNGGINVGALYQRIVFINGKTYKPTRIVNLHRTPGGAWLRRSKGKWIKLDLFRSNYLVGMERLLSVAERVGEF